MCWLKMHACMRVCACVCVSVCEHVGCAHSLGSRACAQCRLGNLIWCARLYVRVHVEYVARVKDDKVSARTV
jgi:hypothetical protein